MKQNKKSTLKRLAAYTKPYLLFIILSLVCALISVLLTLAGPIIIGEGIDLIIGKGNVDFESLPKTMLTLALTVAGSALFQWLMSYFNNIITYRSVKDLRHKAFDKLMRVPLKYIDTTSHGDIISRTVNDIDMVSDALLQTLAHLFPGIVTIIATLLFMLSVNPIITAVVALLTPLSLFVASFIAKGTYKYFTEQSVAQGQLTGLVNELITNQKVVRAFGYEEKSKLRHSEINSHLYKCGFKAQFYSALVNPCTRFTNNIVYAAVAIIGALSAVSGNITVGQISMFLSYANQYTKPFNEISDIIGKIQSALASAERVFSVIDQKEETPDSDNAVSEFECRGGVSLEHVSFSYTSDRKLIENLNLNAEPGSRIAIVGPTGCGKTTLINLLMRFYDTDSGVIKIDGIDIHDMTRSCLRKNYGMVLQETWLFNGTVYDNIAYGAESATREQVESAAKRAHAHSFISKLPQGYDTVIADDGGNISQGQKQLLCIARAMLVDAPMLILDEATSNIDTRTEVAVQRAFTSMMEGRTSFIVAHRLSTIREADMILVMKNGSIIEQGDHESLMKLNGFYAELISAMI